MLGKLLQFFFNQIFTQFNKFEINLKYSSFMGDGQKLVGFDRQGRF